MSVDIADTGSLLIAQPIFGAHALTSADRGTGVLEGQTFTISNASHYSYDVSSQGGPTSQWFVLFSSTTTAGFYTTNAVTKRNRNPSLSCTFQVYTDTVDPIPISMFVGFSTFNGTISSQDVDTLLDSRAGFGLSTIAELGSDWYWRVAHNDGDDTTIFHDFNEPWLTTLLSSFKVDIQAQEENDAFSISLQSLSPVFSSNVSPDNPEEAAGEAIQSQTLTITGELPETDTNLRPGLFLRPNTGIIGGINLYRWQGYF